LDQQYLLGKGYDKLLDPMQKASAHFFEKVIKPRAASSEPRTVTLFFHLLLFLRPVLLPLLGRGDLGGICREICRRLEAILQHDF